MSLTAGVRLGPYEILAPLGAGGMGEVYRARDTRLDRTVALKVLPSHLSADLELQLRFEREARAISSLNHPNICALYDVGAVANPESPGPNPELIRFLVMELVDGESLFDRLARGPLPLDQALARGIEITDALSSAHRRGIVHRDLKPGNVMLTKAGAKLLDFGLAKSGVAVAGSGVRGGTALPTTPHNLTAQGTILGTFQYMAPEQLEGVDADARTDIFAFGAVLYEMITGRRAFAGKSHASLIGAILRDHPPALSSVITVTPTALDRLVAKCLAKDPDDRWQDASDLRDELRWIASGDAESTVAMSTAAKGRPREWVPWTLFAVALMGVVALAAPYFGATPPLPAVVRFTLSPPEGVVFAPAGAPIAPFPSVSPDGNRLAFVANRPDEAASIWVRSLDSLDARRLNDTTVRTDNLSAALPFWSSDSRSIGFFADGKLKRVDLDGGSPQTICDAPQSGGASWGANGTIVFASKIDEGLYKVAASGGTPVQITKPDLGAREISHSNPAFLPDGRHFLFWVHAPKSSIRVGSIDSPETRHLFESDSRAAYSSGHVFFVRQTTLFAQPFDTARLETSGEPVAVAEGVRTFPLNGRSTFSVSSNGVLVYRTGATRVAATLAWHDRSGKEIAVVPDSNTMYGGMSLARDESRLIAQIDDGRGNDLWTIDLVQGTRSRVTSDARTESAPVFSADGRFVVFSSDRNGPEDLFWKRADGVGDEQLLVESQTRKTASDWSEHWITFTAVDPTSQQDLWVVPRDGGAKPYLQTEFNERDGRLSPDERWMAYTSDEAGRSAVYIRPFPNASEGRWRVSGGGGGAAPRWRADGREVFYIADDGGIVAVPVKLGDQSPELGVPQVLFQPIGVPRVLFQPSGPPRALYAVSRDGSRFLLPVRGEGNLGEVPLTVVINVPTLLVGR